MAEISIKLIALNAAITKLNNLKTTCTSMDTSLPSSVGGGLTVNEMESIANLYKSMNANFADLISNTALFMENVKKSYQTTDTKAANKLSGN